MDIIIDKDEQIRIYWERRKNCDKGKHKLRDNDFGVTWCVVCGCLSNKPAGIELKTEDQIIWKNGIPKNQEVMTNAKKVIVYLNVLGIYQKSNSLLGRLLGTNRYERNITKLGLKNVFFILGYKIHKFDEISELYPTTPNTNKASIKLLKHCVKTTKLNGNKV